MERSSSRGEQIKSSLLDPKLTDKMIQQLSDKTGDRQMKNSFWRNIRFTKSGDSTSCVQLLLCKVFPYISTAQKATGDTMNSLFGNSLQMLRYN